MDSNRGRPRSSPVRIIKVRADTDTRVSPIPATETATRIEEVGRARPWAVVSSRPRASARNARKITARVVTLTPPAVDTEPPPTNINASVMSMVDALVSTGSMTAKPPERIITEANTDCCSLSATPSPPRVAPLLHSNAANPRAPTSIRSTLTSTVSRVWRFQRPRCHWCFHSTRRTGKPRLPRNTAQMSAQNTTGSSATGARPPGSRTNPALLNADTA